MLIHIKLISVFVILMATFSWPSYFNSEEEFHHSQYPEHLEGALTGGFGEQTCHSCHFDYDLNWEEGSLSVSGIPEQITPETLYELEVELSRPSIGRAGFQLSARFADGSQAGRFEISEDEHVMLTKDVPDSLQFVQHSVSGTHPSEDNRTSWIIQWRSPKKEMMRDSIIFNIAANAANGDESEFGDWIYVREIVVTKE